MSTTMKSALRIHEGFQLALSIFVQSISQDGTGTLSHTTLLVLAENGFLLTHRNLLRSGEFLMLHLVYPLTAVICLSALFILS